MPLSQPSNHGRLPLLMALCLLCGLLMISCQGQNVTAPAEKSIARSYDQPPFDLELSISHPKITVAETLVLTLTAIMPEEYQVEFPEFPEFTAEPGSFRMVRQNISRPQLIDHNRITKQLTMELEPFLAGEYLVPALQIVFRSEKEKTSLTTEPVKITVTSLLADNINNPKLSAIAPPVKQPLSKTTIAWLLAGLMVLVIIGLLFYRFYPRHRKEKLIPVIPAHVTALKELRHLLNSQLLVKGEVKIFHQGVSGILRRYIENRFGLQAPERTTEEFLTEIAATPVLREAHKLLLKKFLSHCDLVKFAEHQPAEGEIHQTTDLGRQFIEETKEIST